MSRPVSFLALLGTLFVSAGCSGSAVETPAPGTFPAAPLTSLVSASGALHVDVRSSPLQPPIVGNTWWSYTFTEEATGKPVTGLSLDVVPWMPAMGHGTSTVPSVSNTGGGVYVIEDVELFMPGQWDLRTSIAGPEDDKLVVSVDVP
jgi:hypothetical protein